MMATGLLGLWWAWPVLLVDVWGWTPSRRWLWVLALEEAFVGVMWATAGISALTQFGDHELLIGVAWGGFPVALAGAGIVNRRRHNRLEPTPAK
jgi:hypothetical protein